MWSSQCALLRQGSVFIQMLTRHFAFVEADLCATSSIIQLRKEKRSLHSVLFVLFRPCSQLILVVDRDNRQLAAAHGKKALMKLAFAYGAADRMHCVN